jgi:2'-hydroxyisoflavone reductase
MQLLIIGGTAFLGRALVDAAQAHQHQLTLFNRGKTNPGLFPEITTIAGDREIALDALGQQDWDAVIDTCSYFPQTVEKSAQYLINKTKQYVFISTLSVYADTRQTNCDESSPVGTLPPDYDGTITGESYGPLKALCEQEVLKYFPENGLIIRPGLIVGPHDYSDRFSYWPYRISRGGEVLAPGRPERFVQFIDVRDLAEWTIHMVEKQANGIYNVNGQPKQTRMKDVLEACQKSSGTSAHLKWLPDSFLIDHGAEPWMELPLWLPESEPSSKGFFDFNISKALKEGLKFRPLNTTISDTSTWLETRPSDHPWRAGLSREKEKDLLAHWHDLQNRNDSSL